MHGDTPADDISFADMVETFGPYDLYMLATSVLALGVLAVDAFFTSSPEVHQILGHADTLLCALFFFDFIRSLRRARDRGRYFLRTGWLDLLSSVPAIGALRLGRLVRVARIVKALRAVRSARMIGRMIARHRRQSAILTATLLSLVLLVGGSLAILEFERGRLASGEDALWWAFSTLTTLGYHEHPATLGGRIIAAVLVAAGIVLFGALSGFAASWFVRPELREERDRVATLAREVERLRAALEARTEFRG